MFEVLLAVKFISIEIRVYLHVSKRLFLYTMPQEMDRLLQTDWGGKNHKAACCFRLLDEVVEKLIMT